MVNKIIGRQNEADNLIYLAAQRNLYSNAKLLVKIEFAIGLLIGALYFFLPAFLPSIFSINNWDYSIIKPFIGFIAPLSAFVFTIIDLSFINPEIENIKVKAAKIQENFDCAVLLLPWNIIKIDHLGNEEINKNANKYKKKEHDLKSLHMWYTEPSIKDLPLEVGRIYVKGIIVGGILI